MSSVATPLEKKNSWSFGFKSTTKDIKPVNQASLSSTLPKDFFTDLIKLEGDFFNGSYTLQTLSELTQCYARAAEHYDHNKDNIATYFIFKIQDILATQKSLMLLSQTEQKGDNKGTSGHIEDFSHRQQGGSHIREETCEDEEDTEEMKRQREKQINRRNSNPQSFAQIRNQKQRLVQFFYKIENEIQKEKQTLKVVLEDFKDKRQSNDNSVKTNLNNQKQRLREKLEQRKQKSFVSQSLNSNSFSFPLRAPGTFIDNIEGKDKNGSSLESVLKALDDGEEVDSRKFISSKPESINGELTPVNLSACDDSELKGSSLYNRPKKTISGEKSEDEDNFKSPEQLKQKKYALVVPKFKGKLAEDQYPTSSNSDGEKLSTDKDTCSEKENSIEEKTQIEV